MSLYDQRLLADANTDNYSTIVAFEEQEQHQQARTLQDSGYLSDHNASDANVIVGGGGSILAIGVVVLAFLSARNKRNSFAIPTLTTTLASIQVWRPITPSLLRLTIIPTA